MLQVVGVLPVGRTSLEVDDYVPFMFRCQDYETAVPLYWRTGDLDYQLLEIGFAEHSGALGKLTVVLLGSSVEKAEEEPHATVPGIPVFDRSLWPVDSSGRMSDYERRFRDEPQPFRVRVGSSFVRIDLGPGSDVIRWIAAGRMEFGLDGADRIVSLEFSNLTVEEMKLMDYHLNKTI